MKLQGDTFYVSVLVNHKFYLNGCSCFVFLYNEDDNDDDDVVDDKAAAGRK